MRGSSSLAGGCILSRHNADLQLRNVSFAECSLTSSSSRGGAIAAGSHADQLVLLATTQASTSTALGVMALDWSPDGKFVVSAGGTYDAALRIHRSDDMGSTPVEETPAGGSPNGHSTSNYVGDVAWSPGGEFIASCAHGAADNSGELMLWNSSNLSAPLGIGISSNTFTSVAWSPDGLHIATAEQYIYPRYARLRIWASNDLSAGPLTNGSEWSASVDINAVAWSPDGAHLAAASSEGLVRVFSVPDIDDLVSCQPTSSAEPYRTVAWSPDSTKLVGGSDNFGVQVWSFDKNGGACEPVSEGMAHGGSVHSVGWSSDGRHLVSSSEDATLRMWDATTLANTLAVGSHTGEVHAVKFSPDGTRIASGGKDQMLTLWHTGDTRSQVLKSGITGTQDMNFIFGVDWSPTRLQVVTVSGYGGVSNPTINVWDVANMSDGMAKSPGTAGPVVATAYGVRQQRAVAVSPDGARIATASTDMSASPRTHHLSVFSYPIAGTLTEDATVQLPATPYAVKWSPDGSRLATATSWDVLGTVRLFEWGADQLHLDLVDTSSRTSTSYCLAWSPKGDRIVSGEWYYLFMWNNSDLAGGPIAQTSFLGDANAIRAVAWSPDGKWIVSASGDRKVLLFDADTFMMSYSVDPVATGIGHGDQVRSLAWAPDSTQFVSGSEDRTIKIWHVKSLDSGPLATGGPGANNGVGHTEGVWSVAWSRDGEYIASGSDDNTLLIWRRLTFRQTLNLTDVEIRTSDATHGGAMSVHQPEDAPSFIEVELLLWNTSFEDNTASVSGGALALIGDSSLVATYSELTTASIVSSTFRRCTAGTSGGAIFAEDTHFELRDSDFDANTASDGAALHYRGVSPPVLSTAEASRFVGNSPDPTVRAYALIDWTCPSGHYMPQVGAANGDFDGCFACLDGYFGTGLKETEPTCNSSCPKGHFCPSGSSMPTACARGLYLPSVGAARNESCIKCSAGRFGTQDGASSCATCLAGTYTDSQGQTECAKCAAGGYCEVEGADTSMVFTPCPPGTWSAAFGANSSAACQNCSAGTYLPSLGASSEAQCTACRKGGACQQGSAEPAECVAGRFQNSTGATACILCTLGSYCDVAASTPLPCPGGRFGNTTGLTSQAECHPCPPGQFCLAGSVEATECDEGTSQPYASRGACDKCVAGRFMNATGATACHDCALGAYCKLGAAAALPCMAGSLGNATGLASQDDCHPCPPGHFCFAGSVKASACSAGTYAQNERSQLCGACEEGKYQGAEGATACVVCDDGFSCPEGSVVPIPVSCEERTFLNNTLAATLDDPMDACMPCPEGSWCAGGSTQPQRCSRGTYCPANASKPTDCVAGRYGSEPGLTDAHCSGVCSRGHYCEAGSSTPLPCVAGRYHDAALDVLLAESDCVPCPPGASCPAGASQPSPCAPGSVAPNTSAAVCTRCEAGTFQSAEQATACEVCTEASWCAAGSSAPTPCSNATYGNGTGLRSAAECLTCGPGSWCSAGEAIPCGTSTYNNKTGASNVDDCTACPANSFSAARSTSVESCRCNRGYYDATAGEGVDCQPCPVGSTCEGEGATLASLPLLEGYYRASSASADPRVCPTYARVRGPDRCGGGATPGDGTNASAGACRGALSGVYCTACPNSTYLSGGGECVACGSMSASMAGFAAALVIGVLLLLLLTLLGSRRVLQRVERLSAWRRVTMLAESAGLAAKAKQLITFYQMATSIQSAFLVTFPDEVRRVLSAFEIFSLNLFELGLPFECLGLSSFLSRLSFLLLAPLVLVACTPLLAMHLLHNDPTSNNGGIKGRRNDGDDGSGVVSSARAVLMRALPVALKLLFVVFPLVSAVAVQAFDCERLDNGEHWLRSDYSLLCGTDSATDADGNVAGGGSGSMEPSAEYRKVRGVAVLALLLYPVGVPLLFLGLLLSCRKQLSRVAPSTPLSASLQFLCAEYRKRFFFWEVLYSVKKLFFISFIRLVNPGTLLQPLLALVVAQSWLVCQLTAAPFKHVTDNALAVVSGTAYCFLLLGALVLQLHDIYGSLFDNDKLSLQLIHKFGMPALPVLAVTLISSTLAAVAFSLAVLLPEALRDMRQPKLRYVGSHTLVTLPLPTGKTHHLFISHIWSTAQDQARVLRQWLRNVVPGLRVWLDVEDLTDISALEEAVDASETVLVLITAGYFQSRNCMRELTHCVATAKPLIAVAERDSAHGGLTEAEARQQCVAAGAKFASWGFGADGPSADALVDALLGTGAAADAVVGTSRAAGKPGSSDDRSSIVYERIGVFQQAMLRLIVQRLVGHRRIYMPLEVRLSRRGALAPPSSGHQFHVWCSAHNPGAIEMLNEFCGVGRYQGRLLVTQEISRLSEVDHALLFLNLATWNDDGQRKLELTREIRHVLEQGRKLLLVHETDEERGGVQQFGHFFGSDQTPRELLGLKIYTEIAIAMKEPQYRSVSLGLLDHAINAGRQRAGGHGGRSSLSDRLRRLRGSSVKSSAMFLFSEESEFSVGESSVDSVGGQVAPSTGIRQGPSLVVHGPGEDSARRRSLFSVRSSSSSSSQPPCTVPPVRQQKEQRQGADL